MKSMWFFEKRVWLSGFAGLFVAYMCCLQGCAEKTTKQESPCRASRVVSPSGEEGAAESLPASPASNESFPDAFPLGDTPKEEAKAPPAGR